MNTDGLRRMDGHTNTQALVSLAFLSVFSRVHLWLEQTFDHFAVYRDAECVGLLAGDADAVVHGGGHVGGGDGVVVRPLAAGVARANDAAAANAAAGHEGAVAMLPMVAARFVVDLRRSAELAHDNH